MNNTLLTRGIKVEHKWPANFDNADIDEFVLEKEYSTFDAYLKVKKNVLVSPDSVVYNGFFLDTETTASVAHIPYYRFRHLFRKRFLSKQVRLPKGKLYLLATDYWSAGHFHWFCDLLPRLWLIRDNAAHFTLLLPDVPYIRNIGMESFDLLGLKFHDIVWMKSESFYHVPELHFVSPVHRSGHMHPVILNEVRSKLMLDSAPGAKRLYISREKAAYRKVVNEKGVIEILKQYGFEVVLGENLSLRQQVELFSKANTLLGLHGAGLTNTIFQNPGSNLIELRKKENGPSNVGYWHLADVLAHNFYYFNGLPDSELPLVGRGCNLKVDLADFENKILQVIS